MEALRRINAELERAHETPPTKDRDDEEIAALETRAAAIIESRSAKRLAPLHKHYRDALDEAHALLRKR